MYENSGGPQAFARIYSGTHADGYCLSRSLFKETGEGGQASIFCLLDLPLSIGVDTILLPVTAVEQIAYGSFRARCVERIHQQALEHAAQARGVRLQSCRRLIAEAAIESEQVTSCRAYILSTASSEADPAGRDLAGRCPRNEVHTHDQTP